MNLNLEPTNGPLLRQDWATASTTDLVDHILARYHERHREQLPELIGLAMRVEQAHAGRPGCPAGLAELLTAMAHELENHMRKEELVLFPMLARGHGGMAAAPISVMRMEHDDHDAALRRLAELTDDLTAPASACGTWLALYDGLRVLRDELREHMRLENDVLFERFAPAASH